MNEKAKRQIMKVLKSERLACVIRTILILSAACPWSVSILHGAGVMKENILMVFLIGILLIGALTSGYEYGIAGAVISVLMFNYFLLSRCIHLRS